MSEPESTLQLPAVGVTVDVRQALLEMLAGAVGTCDWAYPNCRLDDDRAHAALQKLRTNLNCMQTLLKAIK